MSGPEEQKRESEMVGELLPKRPYAKPDLVVHGTVEQITENTSTGPDNDGALGRDRYYSR